MKKFFVPVLFSATLLALCAQMSCVADRAFSKKADEFISRILTIQNSAKLVKDADGLMTLNLESFDVERYIASFDKLDLGNNLKNFKVHYVGGFFAGYPMFYVQEGEFLPIKDNHDPVKYFNVEDSPEGYLQLLVYHIIGERFALLWHSNYEEKHIICTPERLNAVYEARNNSEYGGRKIIDSLVFERNYAPTFTVNKDSLTISVYTFSPFGGGLNLESYSIKRASPFTAFPPSGGKMIPPPHTITELESKNIMKYDCGIMF